MNKYEIIKAVQDSRENPYIQYYIVRSSLNMTAAKLAVQIGHGAWLSAQSYFKKESPDYFATSDVPLDPVRTWMKEGYRKVLLDANDKDFERVKKELDGILIIDAGLTEIEPGSETVYVLYPMRKNERPKFLKRMRLYVHFSGNI